MLLELIVEIRDREFLDILPDKVDRTGRIIPIFQMAVSIAGSVIGAERWKWETEYILKVRPEGTTFDAASKALRSSSAITRTLCMPKNQHATLTGFITQSKQKPRFQRNSRGSIRRAVYCAVYGLGAVGNKTLYSTCLI